MMQRCILNVKGRPAREPPKSRSYKKYVIIAAVSGGILALAVILTGILVGVRPFTHAQKDIMRVSSISSISC